MQLCRKCESGKGCNEGANNNLLLMPIKKIAAWQILFSDDPDLEENYRKVMLPALQRGAVWKPKQVEFLWDSLMRGFPTGSFLFSPFDERLGKKEAKHDGKPAEIEVSSDRHHFHLLDGQQRANAIALGFLNPWTKESHENDKTWPPAVLWIDLSPKKIPSRKFGFRVVTRAHPWGYSLISPEAKLGAADYRNAIKSFEEAYNKNKEANKNNGQLVFKPGKLALTHAWPWDTTSPVPFCFLVESINEAKKLNKEGKIDCHTVKRELKRLMEFLPFWGHWKEFKNYNVSIDKQIAVEKAIEEIDSALLESVEKMLEGSIPALVMNIDGQGDEEERNGSNDAIEELFIRVNAGGTKLEGEELIYSILKSVMPDVHHMIENLATNIMPPSRLVSLAIRVYEARRQRESNKNENPPEVPSVGSFRRLIQKDKEDLIQFIKSDDIKELIKKISKILKFKEDKEDYGLPPVLVTDIARKSADFFFYLLVWLDIHKAIQPGDRKALIGFLTALHWLSTDKGRCLKKLWKHLDRKEIWSRKVLLELIPMDEDRRLLLLPVPPEKLRDSINSILETIDDSLWKKDRWEFRNQVANNEILLTWIKGQNFFMADKDGVEGIRQLIDRILEQRGLLLYAQRGYIARKFADYDPSNLDPQEDSARPWDYDHIHPSFYIYGRWHIPQLIKTFHSTNGNYRAWPMEDNRSDQEDCPKCKLLRKCEPQHDPLIDSFITQESWDNFWIKSLPTHDRDKCGEIDGGYLFYNDKYSQEIECLFRAILGRTVDIYAEWYVKLEVELLFSQPDA